MNKDVTLLLGDCLEVMNSIPGGSVDMVMADPPYGTTACKWDSVIPLNPMWEQLKRIVKPNCAIVMTASQPFTTTLIASNISMFKYCWVWDKKKGGNMQVLKWQPYRVHEDVVVFSKGAVKYYPIKTPQKERTGKTYSAGEANRIINYGDLRTYKDKHPKSIIEISNANQKGKVHPTQKPVALMEYLIKTYTNEGETVLDFTMGSGTTGVACINTNRRFIGIEKDEKYFEIASNRINEALSNHEAN
ncbi:putative DNA methyltransferase N-4/N-6 [Enterobacteria phage mEp021]|nr:putative DNA methyltransferase N-4/N-6 [Enterobacteria phage mEp021]